MFPIFDKLGGDVAALEALAAAAGKPGWPSVHTVRLWRQNREIPGKATKLLMRICEERGIAYAAADFEAGASSCEAAE
jgi:hypothetical protein